MRLPEKSRDFQRYPPFRKAQRIILSALKEAVDEEHQSDAELVFGVQEARASWIRAIITHNSQRDGTLGREYLAVQMKGSTVKGQAPEPGVIESRRHPPKMMNWSLGIPDSSHLFGLLDREQRLAMAQYAFMREEEDAERMSQQFRPAESNPPSPHELLARYKRIIRELLSLQATES